MPHPHHNAGFLIAVSIIMVVGGLLFPMARLLDPRIGVPMASLPLIALVTVCIVFWRRAHSGEE